MPVPPKRTRKSMAENDINKLKVFEYNKANQVEQGYSRQRSNVDRHNGYVYTFSSGTNRNSMVSMS